MRILLVEDEPDLGAAIHRSLSRDKDVVDWVQDGLEAWDCLEYASVHYTLAIFDWLLPGLTGIELCQRLRSHHNALPVLMLTAKDRMEDKVIGLDAGADDYLIKPFGKITGTVASLAASIAPTSTTPHSCRQSSFRLCYCHNFDPNCAGKKPTHSFDCQGVSTAGIFHAAPQSTPEA